MEQVSSFASSGIEFQAVTEGLGFHPFKDGLPYSPAIQPSKGRNPELAGPIGFHPSISHPRQTPARGVKPQSIEDSDQARAISTAPGPYFLTRRSVSYLLDSALNGVLLSGLAAWGLGGRWVNVHFLMSPPVVFGGLFVFFLQNWFTLLMLELIFGTTLGKKLLGLKIKGNRPELVVRSLLFFPSIGFCGAGLLWSFFNSDKQCWHDWISGISPTESD